MKNTPRTDKKAFGKKVMAHEMVHADFSRQLERELASAIKALEQIEDTYISGFDTAADRSKMGQIATKAIQTLNNKPIQTLNNKPIKQKIKSPLFEAVWFYCEDFRRGILEYECIVTANGFERSFDGVIPISEKQDPMTLLREHIRQNIIKFLADILSAEFIDQYKI